MISFSFGLPVGSFADPNGPLLAISATLADGQSLPNWLSFSQDRLRFSGFPPRNFHGSLEIAVIASDGKFTVSDSFTLTVSPTNDYPTAILFSSSIIAENAAGGTIVGQLTTEDSDSDDTHTYVVVGGEVGKFDILDDRLMVRTGAALDYETAQSLPVVVRSTDQAGASIERILQIELSDIAEDVLGTLTDDKIVGTRFADRIVGRAGNDQLDGDAGDDIYVYSRGDGQDTITEGMVKGRNDRLVLSDVNPSEVSLQRSGNDVTLLIAGGGSVLLKSGLEDYFDQGIEKIAFADGTEWSRADLRSMVLANATTPGNNSIVGFSLPETLAGGRGNDLLNGDAGDDIYVYARGDGQDTITEGMLKGRNDRLVLSDIDPSEVSLQRSGWTLLIAGGGSVLLKRRLRIISTKVSKKSPSPTGQNGAGPICVRWYWRMPRPGQQSIVGFSLPETFAGGRGNDLLNGDAGDEISMSMPAATGRTRSSRACSRAGTIAWS